MLDSSELSSTALSRLFGFSDPLDRAPAPARPLLTQWRLAALRERWRQADHLVARIGQPPVIDPEVLVPRDIIDPASPAANLLDDRISWRTTQLDAPWDCAPSRQTTLKPSRPP